MRIGKSMLALFLLLQVAFAAEVGITGVVTYRTSTSVYTSLGSDAGVADSTLLFVISGRDTVARLKVIAVSSKSSVCRILDSRRDIVTGSRVSGTVSLNEIANSVSDDEPPAMAPTDLLSTKGTTRSEPSQPDPIEVKGRVSAQFYGTRQEESGTDVTQPGIVLSVNARSTEIPVTFDMYANVRTQSFDGESPFSAGAVNRSRIYRLLVAYDNGTDRMTFGRFSPSLVPSLGYIDGLMGSTTVEEFTFGAAVGFQPSYSQRGVSTDRKKFALFTSYRPDPSGAHQISLAYARTYYRTLLDREAVNVNGRATFSRDVSMFAYVDLDLRSISYGALTQTPQITQANLQAEYRIIPELGIGLGGNVARPLYPYTLGQTLSSTLTDTKLRGGLSFSVRVYLAGGVSLTNTYTPRTSDHGFADNFTENVSLNLSNIASSGFAFRANFSMSETEYTKAHGFGLNLAKNWWDLFDLTLRYQQSEYTVRGFNLAGQSTTMGADFIIPLGRTLSFDGAFERLESPGVRMNTIFAELTVRF
jgi:hypothetical protein